MSSHSVSGLTIAVQLFVTPPILLNKCIKVLQIQKLILVSPILAITSISDFHIDDVKTAEFKSRALLSLSVSLKGGQLTDHLIGH
jgi:hypothetical protein